MIPTTFTPPAPPPETAVEAARNQHNLGERPFLLFLGDVTKNKGVLELLTAFEKWQPHQPEVGLVLAGTNRLGRPFTDRVAQMPHTFFLGQIPHPQALALIQAAEMVLLPSRSEGLPSVILEAVALGKKVLCPPQIAEFEAHLPEFVLPQVTVEAIYQAIQKIWHNPARPSYPLENHLAANVVPHLVAVYKMVAAAKNLA